ncbi:MAG: hypothetical protein EPN30_04625 [Actinomycetota bacterium]|nr:MAG: hypothetical protein EPN30_04625 [Actinomycetota bacterium]
MGEISEYSTYVARDPIGGGEEGGLVEEYEFMGKEIRKIRVKIRMSIKELTARSDFSSIPKFRFLIQACDQKSTKNSRRSPGSSKREQRRDLTGSWYNHRCTHSFSQKN